MPVQGCQAPPGLHELWHHCIVGSLNPATRLSCAAVYAGLEVFLLPATPVALTGGALFGVLPGTLISAIGGSLGAATAFTLGRTVAREPVSKWAAGSKPFRAMERALNQDGFKVVLLVNLSPLASLANLLNYGACVVFFFLDRPRGPFSRRSREPADKPAAR